MSARVIDLSLCQFVSFHCALSFVSIVLFALQLCSVALPCGFCSVALLCSILCAFNLCCICFAFVFVLWLQSVNIMANLCCAFMMDASARNFLHQMCLCVRSQ